MDLRRWTHVVAVADRRSFVRAAEQVHLSQPALTRSIQAAEAELGLLLFDRKGSEVAAGRLKLLEIRDLPLLQAQAGVVTLRGRTPSRMAELIISRLPLLNE